MATEADFERMHPLLAVNAAKKKVNEEEYMASIRILLKDSDFGFAFIVEQPTSGQVVAVFATAFYWDFWFNGNRLNVQALEFHPAFNNPTVFTTLRQAVDAHWKALPLRIVGVYYFYPLHTPAEELEMLREWFDLTKANWVVITNKGKL